MIYVPEILNARLQDNIIDAKKMRTFMQELNERFTAETDLTVKDGINAVIIETLFEYESLTRESREIRKVLSMIEKEFSKKDKKKRAPSLQTARLNPLVKHQLCTSL